MIGDDEDVFAAAMSGADMPETGTLENLATEVETPAAKTPDVEAPSSKEGAGDAIPSWRLREESERRREAEREAVELREFKAKVEKERAEAEKAKDPTEIWDRPDEFVQEGAQRLLDPVTKQLQETQSTLQQTREFYSKRDAEREHGADKVTEAYKALDAAIGNGSLNKDAVLEQLRSSMDPYGDIMSWHKQHSLLTEIGNDPEAYRQRQREELLKDPEFLAKAVEAARGQATPVTAGRSGAPAPNNVTSLPSLNRTPAAARDEEEPEDAVEVFNSALGGRRR